MLMGDISLDCSHINDEEMAKLPLRSDPAYLWLIGDHEDTTLSKTDCAHDRLVNN